MADRDDASNEETDIHPVVTLLLRRMESHPDEFKEAEVYNCRWAKTINAIRMSGNKAEVAVMEAGLRKIQLEQAYIDALDELCNGDERRQKMEDARKQAVATQQTQLNQLNQQNQINQQHLLNQLNQIKLNQLNQLGPLANRTQKLGA